MDVDKMTDDEVETQLAELEKTASKSSGKLTVELQWTPQSSTVNVTFYDDNGNPISAEDEQKIVFNPYLHAHLVAWGLRFRYLEIVRGSQHLLQQAMQAQEAAASKKEPLPGTPESIANAMDRIKAAAHEGRGKSKIILT